MKQQHERDSMSSDKSLKSNKPSSLLTHEENEYVFNILGRKCQTQFTSVIQLFTTSSPAHSHWTKRYTGALCFVKDSSKRSYFCRLYCLHRGEMVWEQEMYDSIDIVKRRPFLVTFEGQDGIVAFNFVSEDETDGFYNVAKTTMANRNRRREERNRRSNNRREPPSRPPPATNNNNNNNVIQNNNRNDTTDHSVTLRNPQKNYPQPPPPQPMATMGGFGAGIGGGGAQAARRGNRKLTKADISMPSDFKHVTHVGWSPQRGFDWTGEENDALQPFLEKAGVSDQQLKDRETRAFIYDFIQNHKVLESVKSDNNPPPVPTRGGQNSNSGTGQRQAPPPPPTRHPGPPPLPKTAPPPATRAPAPTRPPPITNTPNRNASAVAPPPPPPPPPMMSAVPPPPPMSGGFDAAPAFKPPAANPADPRNALMDSIRKGAQLKKIDPANESTSSGGSVDMRQDLMSEIRQGQKLRPASERELSAKADVPHTDALAAALREALANRGRVIQSSDEDSSDSYENDGEWDD